MQQSATGHELICAWLHLPAGCWPPDHYTLLGLEPGEADLRRIEEQAGARMQQVRRYQLSYPDQATEAMNRLAQALVCLTDPEAKQIYDDRLPAPQPEGPLAPAGTFAWAGLNGAGLRTPLMEPGRPSPSAGVRLLQAFGLLCVLAGLTLAGAWAWTALHPEPSPPSSPETAAPTLLPREVHRLNGHSGTIHSMAFSPDGRWVLLVDERAVRLLNMEADRGTTVFDAVHPGLALAFAPDGDRFLACDGRQVWLYGVGRQKPLQLFDRQESPVTCATFSPDGHQALSAGADGSLWLWDCATTKEVRQFAGHTGSVSRVAFSPDGHQVMSAGKDHALRWWSVDDGRPLRSLDGGREDFRIADFSADGRRIVSSDGSEVRLFEEGAAGWQERRLEGQPGRITSAALAVDGRRALAGTEEGAVSLWDVDSGRELARGAGHANAVLSVAFARDGRRALSGDRDGTVRVWQLP